MHFEPFKLYRVYNLGINQQPIFFKDSHYDYFLKKVKIEWLPFVDIVSYTLLPTEFYFILYTHPAACIHLEIQGHPSPLQKFSRILGSTLSSYTQGVNKELNRKGSLFHKKTKCSELILSKDLRLGYHDPVLCMNVMHSKPVKLSLCKKPADWKFSSASEYCEPSSNGFCRKDLLLEFELPA